MVVTTIENKFGIFLFLRDVSNYYLNDDGDDDGDDV